MRLISRRTKGKNDALDHSPLFEPPLLFMNTRFVGSSPAAHALTRLHVAPLTLAGWYTATLYRFSGPRKTSVISSSNGARFPAAVRREGGQRQRPGSRGEKARE